ncbi:helix-turn-helix domain-containing protein [Chitinophaga lutea]|uniref:Helix-turn-helix domain-containing protein n=1 Tax=Chitinophaga lutea TaxID=2488634 RepID=A0A3N4PN65_9BACT|nr:helix-turn-helix domain-containing protein [Chitinophaga lutea]RPE08089.1 helix-turn-helix domain-containing protein [Chitinophaga lutea]
MESTIPVKNKISHADHIKAEPFRKEPRKTVPHKHKQYFEIIYLTEGSGEHWIDGVKYPIRPGVLFFISHDQVHNWDLHSEPEGFVLIFKNSFVEKSLDRELEMLLQRFSGTTCLQISEQAGIRRMFGLLAEENGGTSDMSVHIKEGLVKALLAKILDDPHFESRRPAVRTDLFHAFTDLLRTGHQAKMKVSHYAALLHTTPQNLNAACRKAAGLSATAVVAEFIMNEARRQLRYTNKTVSEVSLSLNFTDASHFVKFFKRMTGQTPQAYRAAQ